MKIDLASIAYGHALQIQRPDKVKIQTQIQIQIKACQAPTL